MTEAEWLASCDLWDVIKRVQEWVSERKLRLLAAASCSCLSDLLNSSGIRDALEAAEHYADGRIDVAVLEGWCDQATKACEELEREGHSLLSPQLMAYRLGADTTKTGRYSSALDGVAGAV